MSPEYPFRKSLLPCSVLLPTVLDPRTARIPASSLRVNSGTFLRATLRSCHFVPSDAPVHMAFYVCTFRPLDNLPSSYSPCRTFRAFDHEKYACLHNPQISWTLRHHGPSRTRTSSTRTLHPLPPPTIRRNDDRSSASLAAILPCPMRCRAAPGDALPSVTVRLSIIHPRPSILGIHALLCLLIVYSGDPSVAHHLPLIRTGILIYSLTHRFLHLDPHPGSDSSLLSCASASAFLPLLIHSDPNSVPCFTTPTCGRTCVRNHSLTDVFTYSFTY